MGDTKLSLIESSGLSEILTALEILKQGKNDVNTVSVANGKINLSAINDVYNTIDTLKSYKATTSDATGCAGSCQGLCKGACNTGCTGACATGCDKDCSDGCITSCTGKCTKTCGTGCGQSCWANCKNSCTVGCTTSCD